MSIGAEYVCNFLGFKGEWECKLPFMAVHPPFALNALLHFIKNFKKSEVKIMLRD
jgi:hypothetical protein